MLPDEKERVHGERGIRYRLIHKGAFSNRPERLVVCQTEDLEVRVD